MKNKILTKKLNVFKIFLNGINLIEASAGTGKTFTIVLLYLRLLLGIEKKEKNTKKLLVHEILVVTFTNAAKEELYIRIKNGIQSLYLTCLNKTSTDPVFNLFLKEIEDINEAIYLLKKAKNDIHNCSIYTIHGFCQKILQFHTLHFNSIFQNKIIENEENLYLQATQDFWRKCFYNLPENIINIISKDYNSPDSLLKKIKPYFYIKSAIIKKKCLTKNNLIDYHENNIKKINGFKNVWLFYHQTISKIINNLKINKRIYNEYNIIRWINNITIWARSKTKDYTIPTALKYFTKKNIEKNIKNNISLEHVIFIETDKILKNNFSLKKIVILYAVKKINIFLLKEKKKQSLLGFDDLLSILLKSIKKEQSLRNLIIKKYPAVFIDEFQDTDIQQYKIFDTIYKKNNKIALFLIGDPKQAIYSFRGADIFSYLYAKSKIKKHYYLDTNWRSSTIMCQSINFLFSQNKSPFIFKNIPFTPAKASPKNSEMKFTIKEVPQIPIRFFLQRKKEVYIDDYQEWISKQCANEISHWLNYAKTEQAKITTKNGETTLKSSDIAILVRNQKEANLIQQELNKLNILSVYSSCKKSVFHTYEAQELLWILESILEPDNEKLLKQSFSTHIFKTLSIMQTKSNNQHSYFVLEKLYEYHNIWKKIGIFHMIKNMVLEYQKNSNSIEINMNYEKNLNFLHIAELLEEKFESFCKKISLIRWFQKKILRKRQLLDNEHIRHLNKSESIKIITIHKSKGLEYPIVWIPFSIFFNQSKLSIYHDKEKFKIFFDIEKNNKNIKIADEERLAEDVRFLYVALTRSIVHCSIGISCLKKKQIKNKDHSDIHQSGLGYIIQNGKAMNYENLFKHLKEMSTNKLIEIKYNIDSSIIPKNKKNIYLLSKPMSLKRDINNIWNVTSFSKINKENKSSLYHPKEIILKNELISKKNKKLTIYNFPIGKKTGLMIHYLLKTLDFSHEKNRDWFTKILEKYNIPLKWTSILISWTKNIISTPLNKKEIILSKLEKKSYIKELEFFLPIKKTLYNQELNKIIQSSDPISALSPKFFFNPMKGVIKGFIDLVFLWKKKYYIVDYKSNWLGKNNDFYSNENIKKEIIEKRYDLQYQIYTIAVHKYLEQKIRNYNYKTNFGGFFYIFLRAINDQEKNNGIFHTIPNYSLIKKMIVLTS